MENIDNYNSVYYSDTDTDNTLTQDILKKQYLYLGCIRDKHLISREEIALPQYIILSCLDNRIYIEDPCRSSMDNSDYLLVCRQRSTAEADYVHPLYLYKDDIRINHSFLLKDSISFRIAHDQVVENPLLLETLMGKEWFFLQNVQSVLFINPLYILSENNQNIDVYVFKNNEILIDYPAEYKDIHFAPSESYVNTLMLTACLNNLLDSLNPPSRRQQLKLTDGILAQALKKDALLYQVNLDDEVLFYYKASYLMSSKNEDDIMIFENNTKIKGNFVLSENLIFLKTLEF